MPLYDVRTRAFVDDPWSFTADGAPLPPGPAAVSKTRFLVEGGHGLILNPGEKLDGLEAHIGRLALIALRFGRYADGRPYSVARLLRERHGYTGELRATGDVLRDQIGFMLRAGFDTLDVVHEGTVAALRSGTLVAIRRHYQPALRDERAGPRAWQRLSS